MRTKSLKIQENQLFILILIALGLTISITSFIDKSNFYQLIGPFIVFLIFISIPGNYLMNYIFKESNIISKIVLGSAVIISIVIPLNALFAYFGVNYLIYLLLTPLLLFFLKNNKNKNLPINLNLISIVFFVYLILAVFLIRQSLYVPVKNLDQFLVWPDTYNAISQTAEITNHGPKIYPFVAGANVPLDYHWGAFSLASFLSFLGKFSLISTLFRVEFILLGFLTFGLLFITGKSIGKSNIAGVFSVVLGGLTLFPTFPEFNSQIGLSRPQISTTSMPQFVSNVLLILSIYLIYNFSKNKNNYLFAMILFFSTLSTTLCKGPNGVLIILLTTLFLIILKNIEYFKFVLIPSFLGFLIGYFVVSSPATSSGKSGMSLWLNPKNTLELIISGNNLISSTKVVIFLIILIVISFITFLIGIVNSLKNKQFFLLPLAISAFAGISGSFILEAWGYSQFFLLYGAIPILGIFISTSIFYKQNKFEYFEILLLTLGFLIQPVLFKLVSSFFDQNSSLKLYLSWIISVLVIIVFAIIYSFINNKNYLRNLVLVTLGVGALTGLTKFDAIAYTQPDHPYSISIGTSAVAEYLKTNSSIDDLIATNRHCAGFTELQDCTARQFALTALSERRVFIEGWSYTTCPLSEPITNRYWKESDWKLNQDFFENPQANWERFKKTGVDWLVVDESRANNQDFSSVATLVLKSNVVSLWKINEPYQGQVIKSSNPCGSESNI